MMDVDRSQLKSGNGRASEAASDVEAPAFVDIQILDLDVAARCHWCDADAIFLVQRTSTLSANRYGDPACERCADKWRIEGR